MKTRMVKLRRGNPCVAVLENDTWVPLKLLTEDVLADCSIPPQATESVIAFLSLDERQRAELAKRLTSVWPQAERLQSEIMHPVMPFQPLSCRDFMLYERHAIDAARGYAKRFHPMAYRVARLYEVASHRPFPAFRPGMLWYAQPLYYMGNHLSFLPSEAVVPWPRYTQALDYELELGVVLVRPLFNATPEEAGQAIGGFTVFNDFSARDVQLAEMRSGFGPCKAKHFANVISDVVVTADAVMATVYSRKARVRINGKTVVETSTKGPRHDLASAIAYASLEERLHPGEFFGSGTLPGGCALENGCWLEPGDTIECEIEGVGCTRNVVGHPAQEAAGPLRD